MRVLTGPLRAYVPHYGHGLSELLRHGGTRSGDFIGGISGLYVFICRICPVFMILDKDLGEAPVFFFRQGRHTTDAPAPAGDGG
jgi:hypothetical protein